MRKSLVVLAILGTMSAPSLAQMAPLSPQPQPVKPKMVKKIICERVDVEETTGSRLGSAPKVCKTVEVPAPKGGAASGQQAPANNPNSGY